MNEVTLPPSPNWYFSSILSCASDGTVAWGARNSIAIAKKSHDGKITSYSLISNAHPDRVTSVAFSPKYGEPDKSLLVSGGDEHIVRIWNLETLSAVSSQELLDTNQKVIGVDWSKCDPDLICFVSSEGILMTWNVFYNACQQVSLGKLSATCLACSPHKANVLAVGSKKGLIYVVNLHGNGTIDYKLRGHDVEITSLSWCPTDVNVLSDSASKDMLLASGAKDRSIFVWRAGSDGRSQIELPVPVKPLDSNQHRVKLGPTAGNWTAVCWAEPKCLLATSSWGELISWDFTIGAKSKPICKLQHASHARGLFCIANVPKKNGSEEDNWREANPLIVWTVAQDRHVIRSSITAIECKIEYDVPTQGGYVYCMAACPLDTSRIAYGVGDAMLRLWNLSEPHVTTFDVSAIWQKIMGKVRSLAWHPEKENLLAFGTGEGRVGVCDTNTSKPPVLNRQYHRHTVYSIGWGPNPVNGNFVLYSCGDGELVYYPTDKADKEPKSVVTKGCTEFAWKPDHSCVALGHENGSISFMNRNLKEVDQPIHSMKKAIQCLAWHPHSTATDLNLSPLRNYLAVGINEPTITIFDLTDLVEGIEKAKENCEPAESADSTVTRHKLVGTLCGHIEKVVALAWSPHFSGHLVSGSYDCTAQVWKVESQELIATYTGHTAPVQSCMWSPLDPDYIITGSADFTVRVWKISDQKPVKGVQKTQTKRTRMKRNANKKAAKVAAGQAVDRAAAAGSPKEPASLEQAEAKAAAEVRTAAEPPKPVSVRKQRKERPRNTTYVAAYPKLSSERSFCLKSLRDLMKKAKPEEAHGHSDDLPGPEQLANIFGSAEEVSAIMMLEVAAHESQGRYDVGTEMSMWNSSLRKSLEIATQERRLNDFLVSLAAGLSLKTWQEACESYAAQLIYDSNPTKAVAYLLCVHKIHRAVEVLLHEKMYREAYALARCRLDEGDAIFTKILEGWAGSAARDGNFEEAAQCYAKLGDFEKAARLIGRRKDLESLEVATELAIASKVSGMSVCFAEMAFTEALLGADTAAARALAVKFPEINYREIQVQVFEELKRAVERVVGIPQVLAWLESKSEYGLLRTLGDTISRDFPQFHHLDSNLNVDIVDSEAALWVVVSRHIALAAMAPTPVKEAIHVVGALNAICQYEIVHPDDWYEVKSNSLLIRALSILQSESPTNEESLFAKRDNPVYTSLRAYLCHGLLNWVVENRNEESETEFHSVVELVRELLPDALDQRTVRYWSSTNEINKLEAAVASEMVKLEQVEDGAEEKDCTVALLEQLEYIKSEKQRFVTERICAPSPILVFSKATELSNRLKDEQVKENFTKAVAETWARAMS